MLKTNIMDQEAWPMKEKVLRRWPMNARWGLPMSLRKMQLKRACFTPEEPGKVPGPAPEM